MAEPNTAEVEATVDAAFIGAGLNDTPPAPAAKVVETPADDAGKTEAPVVVAPPVVVPEKPQYVRLTKQEWDNTKAAAGKVSSLESQVAKLMGSTPKGEQIVQQVLETIKAQSAFGEPIEVTVEDFSEMNTDFEELTKQQVAGLNRVLKKLNVRGTGTAAPPAKPVDVKAAVAEALLEREVDALAEAYPDWSDIVGRPPAEGAPVAEGNPFRVWLATQPAEYRQKISQTNSPAVVQSAIARFKAADTTKPATPSSRPDKAAARRAVIEDAVTPRADGSPPPLNQPQTADDGFNAGWKAVKRH